MSNQPDITDFYSVIGGLITGFVGSFVALKNTKQTAEKQFREDLLQLVNVHSTRIEALEEENRSLRERNVDLIRVNQIEIQKQNELLLKVTSLESQKSQLEGRIEYLENRLRELSGTLERLLNERRN
jgi:chromosome segregation ATPase